MIEQTSLSLLNLVFHIHDGQDDENESTISVNRPSAFHLLLAAFTILLHRYTRDTDIVIGSWSASACEPLILHQSSRSLLGHCPTHTTNRKRSRGRCSTIQSNNSRAQQREGQRSWSTSLLCLLLWWDQWIDWNFYQIYQSYL